MRFANLTNVDLNLLVTFNALMEERSITGAARRMFLSQPAMSRAVDRLQSMFNDELLVRTTNGYEPTHRASVIYAELQQLLPRVEALFAESKFDPAELREQFRIESSDWGATVLVPGLVRVLAESAPGVQIDVVPRGSGFERLETNEVDLLLTPEANLMPEPDLEAQHLRSEFLFKEKLVCLVQTCHPLVKRRITMREYLKAQHVGLGPMQGVRRSSSVTFLAERQVAVAKALEQIGQKLDVRVRIPYFVPLGRIVESTDLVATVPLQIAQLLRTPKLRIVAAPFEFQGFAYKAIWHSRNDSTPIHKWMRGIIRTLAGRLK